MYLFFWLFAVQHLFFSLILWFHISRHSNFIRLYFTLRLKFVRKLLESLPFVFDFNIIVSIEYVYLWGSLVRPILLSLNLRLHSIFLLQMLLTCDFCNASKLLVWIYDLGLAEINFELLFRQMITLRFIYGEFIVFGLFVWKDVVCLHFDIVSYYLRYVLSFS